MKTKTQNIVVACSVIEAMMHGVAWFILYPNSNNYLEAVYTDGTKEGAHVKAETRSAIEMYHAYQSGKGPEVKAPNTFSLVSEIQSHRPKPD